MSFTDLLSIVLTDNNIVMHTWKSATRIDLLFFKQ
jgi:hypothetical protein